MDGAGAIRAQFVEEGRVWLRGALSAAELDQMRRLAALGTRPGARIGADDPLSDAVAGAGVGAQLQALWPGMRPVRILSFDKTAGANWGVPWHQDRVIAVDRRADLPGYSNWSQKPAGWHCEPPVERLARMLFVRIHLDPSTAENGAMEIALGSHRAGRVAASEAAARAAECQVEVCEAAPGDVLVLAMLTLHRSLPARIETGRRVLRVDYADRALPAPLRWA